MPNFKKEYELWSLGYKNVCGIDEAGRGALAGPLVAGCVILKRSTKKLFNDSKLLNRTKREELFEYIKSMAVSWSIGSASVEEINLYGIQTATYLCYHRAIRNLSEQPNFLIIDHYRLPAAQTPQLSITKGDQISQTIAAASIVAKVCRDKFMTELDKQHPHYGFKAHLGYGTASHYRNIEKLGLCSLHRKSFIDKPRSNQLNFIYKVKED